MDTYSASNSRNKNLSFVGGLGLGAAAMYLLDPNHGRRRRAILIDKLTSGLHDVNDAADVAVRDLGNRLRGVVAESRTLLRFERCADEVLTERVRSKLGRLSSHPAAIQVAADSACVTLSGPVLESEADQVVRGVCSVRGVKSINNQLEIHNEPGDVPDLQGGSSRRRGELPELLQENWAPATRLLVGAAGASLVGYGLKRRNGIGIILAILGSAVLFRSATNIETRRLLGRRGRRAIDLQKTVHVHAPVEQVYALWQKLEHFPRFMSHLYSVEKTSDGRYRWTVMGPGHIPVSWNAEVTENIPNRVIAWRSEPGSIVASAGIVRFDTENGGTRIHIRMSYNPPGGAVGHAIASLFGVDPRHAMADDLARFKSLLEVGRAGAHGEHVRKEELAV